MPSSLNTPSTPVDNVEEYSDTHINPTKQMDDVIIATTKYLVQNQLSKLAPFYQILTGYKTPIINLS